MDEGKTSFERLLSVMPERWEEKAKELGALVRGREIKSVLDLLRLVFLYLTEVFETRKRPAFQGGANAVLEQRVRHARNCKERI
jgi:hypothetical protein